VYRFGGPVAPRFDVSEDSFARLSQHFFTNFPQLEGIRFSHRWGGAIDTCSRFAVFFGSAHGGRVAYATGYTGLGVCASRFGARVARGAVLQGLAGRNAADRSGRIGLHEELVVRFVALHLVEWFAFRRFDVRPLLEGIERSTSDRAVTRDVDRPSHAAHAADTDAHQRAAQTAASAAYAESVTLALSIHSGASRVGKALAAARKSGATMHHRLFPIVLSVLVLGIVFLVGWLVYFCRVDSVAHVCTSNIVIAVVVVVVSQGTLIGLFIRFRNDIK